jgi:GNAT superfamily N-acetyltransferase
MGDIRIVEREMTEGEFARMKAGFGEHGVEHGNPVVWAERFGFVITDGERFVGCSSGLAYRSDQGYSSYFFLSDLFIEREYRRRGLGTAVLRALEAKVAALGVKHIWTWTAAYEGREFYLKQGYDVFCEQEGWYPAGQSRFGMRKDIQ